jgi:hypothetical protein
MQIGTVAKGMVPASMRFAFVSRTPSGRPPAPRTNGGFRLYGNGEVENLFFIRRAQALGVSPVEMIRRAALRAREGETM